VWPIHTVQFSNHSGYGAWRGEVFAPKLIDDCVEGIAERGVLASCNGVLSGYMGSAGTGAAILRAVARVKAANPAALYCCDPVIGDVGRGIFVAPGIPEFMRDEALRMADIITPNHFELEYLSGRTICTQADLRKALAVVHALGPKRIVVTSLMTKETPDDTLDIGVSDGASIHIVRTPKLKLHINGAGDAMAALFFVHYMSSQSAPEALSRAASSVFGLLKRTADAGRKEMMLIEAQAEISAPTTLFRTQEI
jgi:pyridoxine kinase